MLASASNSPCINVCSIGPKGWCLGCYRTLDEIAVWVRLDARTRAAVLAACESRKTVDDTPCASFGA